MIVAFSLWGMPWWLTAVVVVVGGFFAVAFLLGAVAALVSGLANRSRHKSPAPHEPGGQRMEQPGGNRQRRLRRKKPE